jgi:hypothetical protein
MKSDHRWLLGPDPAPKAEVVELDGDAAKLEPAIMPATPIRASVASSLSVAELREENILLRSQLCAMAASLHKLAGTIEADLEQVSARARAEADRKRRF